MKTPKCYPVLTILAVWLFCQVCPIMMFAQTLPTEESGGLEPSPRINLLSISQARKTAGISAVTTEKAYEGEEEEEEMPLWPIPDADVQKAIMQQYPAIATPDHLLPSPTPLVSFPGLDRNSTSDHGYPPDVSAAVSPNYVMIALNSGVAVYDKCGVEVARATLNEFWGQPESTDIFDPRILYDPYSQRWVIVAVGDRRSATSRFRIRYSVTDDPLGDWQGWSYDADANDLLWADFPCVGFNKNWIVVTNNLYPITGSASSVTKVWAIRKSLLYSGSTPNVSTFSPTQVFTLHPAITYDNNTNTIYLLANFNGNSGGFGYLKLYNISGAEASPVLSSSSFVTSNQTWASSTPDAPQAGTSDKIHTNDSRIQSPPIFRNGSLWMTQTAYLPASNPTRSAVQWWKINPSSASVSQFGRIDSGNSNTFYAFPSIAVNAAEEVLIGFSRFSSTTYASAAYAYRSASDAANTMRDPHIFKAGEETYYVPDGSDRNRWGDYTSTLADVDGSFWTCVDYATSEADVWGTYFAKVDPDGTPVICNSCDQALLVSCGVMIQGTTSGGNPEVVPDCNNKTLNTAPGHWYRFLGDGNEVTFSTCSSNSDFDTQIGVFSGSCNNLICIDANDDDANCTDGDGVLSTVTFTASAGQEYFIYVTGFNDYSGDYELTVCGSASGSCDQAISIGCGDVVQGSTSGAPQNVPECVTTLDSAPGTWYTFTGGGETVTASTCNATTNYDTKIGVFSGSCNNLVCVTGDDDEPNCSNASKVVFVAENGVDYYIYVTGFGSNFGSFELSLECEPIQPPPTAAFTANPTSGIAPLSVNFTNNSSNATSYTWSFPGGSPSSSTSQNPPQVTYSNAGTYTATLTATGPGGAATHTVTIIVNQPSAPTASFTANPTSGVAPLPVNFTNNSSNATSYTWSFPGGSPSSSNSQNPTQVTYTNAGTYTVTLTVTGPGGTATQTATITVSSGVVVPIANFSSSSTCVQVGNGPVTFTDLSQNTPTAWAWQFPGGTPAVSNIPNPSVTYNTPGVYDVVLTASNSAGGNTVTKTGHVTVVHVTAQTVVSGGDEICLGSSVLLSASGANNFLWQGNGLSSNSGAIVSATPTTTGAATYTIVGSTGNCTDAPVTLVIQVNAAPTVNVTVSDNEICTDQSVTFSAQGANSYVWTGAGLSATQGAVVTATLNTAGNFSYTVQGTTNGCASTAQTINIQVLTAPTLGVSLSTASVCQGGSVTLTASGANQYVWSGPGLSSNIGMVVTATPTTPGTANYSVVGSGANGCTASQTGIQVVVKPIPVVQAFANPTTICLGDTVLLTASGADSYQWGGAPGLLATVGNIVEAVPVVGGSVVYSVIGATNDCAAAPQPVSITVENNPLSVSVSVSGCPGPNLAFTASITNGGSFPNVLWYLDGNAIWSGPTYQLFGATNGSQVYCTVGPVDQACTSPNFVQSGVYSVNCITTGLSEIPGLMAAQIMPNPNNGSFQLQVESDRAWSGQWRVFNALGQLVQQQALDITTGVNTVPIELLTIESGTYWLVLESEGRWWRKGFVVKGW